VHGRSRSGRYPGGFVEVDLRWPGIIGGPEQFDRGGPSAGHSGAHEIRTISLTLPAPAHTARDPLIVVCRVLVRIDLK